MKGFIEKGTKAFIYGIEWAYGKQMLGTVPIVGKEILKSDEEYENHNGTLVVSKEKFKQCIDEYVKTTFPKAKHYRILSFDSNMNPFRIDVK